MIDLNAPPSAALLAALVDPGLLLDGADEAVDLLALAAALERVKSYVEACQNEVLAAYAEQLPEQENFLNRGSFRWHAERLGLALGVSGPAAQHRMQQACVLGEKLPQLSAALRAGQVTSHHARLAAGVVEVLPVAVGLAVDAAVVATGPCGVDPERPRWRTPRQCERALLAEVIRVDPAGATARRAARLRDRCVRFRDEPDGMASLWARLAAEDARLMAKELDETARSAHAAPAPGDCRTLDQRRADALVDAVCGAAPDAHPADPVDTRNPADPTDAYDPADPAGQPGSRGGGASGGRGRRGGPHVAVTVAWSTLIGLDDCPADLTGYGPIDADTARRIAADPAAVWRRLVVDPASGVLLDRGTTTYRPPAGLREFVVARDGTCRFPTCDRPAVACELDHRRPYDPADPVAGGSTGPDNLDALCTAHHHLKHEPGWTHARDPDTAASIWTDPTGRTHTTPATRLPTPPAVEPPRPPRDDGDPPF